MATLEEMLAQVLAAQLEAAKPAEPEYATKADVAAAVEEAVKAALAASLPALIAAEVEKVAPVRGEGAGRQGVVAPAATDEQARKAADPVAYICAKAQDPSKLTADDKLLMMALTKHVLGEGMAK